MVYQLILTTAKTDKISVILIDLCCLLMNLFMYCVIIFQQLEIVPLYGDMQVAPFQYIKNSTNFDPSKWPNCESGHVSPQSNILANLEPIREDHMSYISQLSRHSNEV